MLKAILDCVVRPAWAILNPRKNKVTFSGLGIKIKNWSLCDV